jgi:hypothetical protein
MTAIALTEIVQPLIAANEAASAETATVNGESVATVANASSVAQLSVSPEGNQIDVTTEGASEVAVSVANVEDAAMAALAPSKMVVVAMKGGIGADGGDQSISLQTLEYTTASLSPGSTEDFILESSPLFDLLTVFSAYPAWIRVYGTSAARAADTRTSPGGTPPAAGTDFYAEVVTTQSRKTIRLSPIPMIQGTNGQVFLRVANLDTQNREISLTLNTLQYSIPSGPPEPPEPSSAFYWDEFLVESTGNENVVGAAEDATATTLLGQPSVSAEQVQVYIEEGLIESGQGSDFTYEWFVSGIDSLNSAQEEYVRIAVRNSDNSQASELGVAGSKAIAGKSQPGSYDESSIQMDLTGMVHLCIQRVGNMYYLQAKGQLVDSFSNTISGFSLSAFYSSATNAATFGQGRFTSGAALYGTGNFTPPTEAFYSP